MSGSSKSRTANSNVASIASFARTATSESSGAPTTTWDSISPTRGNPSEQNSSESTPPPTSPDSPLPPYIKSPKPDATDDSVAAAWDSPRKMNTPLPSSIWEPSDSADQAPPAALQPHQHQSLPSQEPAQLQRQGRHPKGTTPGQKLETASIISGADAIMYARCHLTYPEPPFTAHPIVLCSVRTRDKQHLCGTCPTMHTSSHLDCYWLHRGPRFMLHFRLHVPMANNSCWQVQFHEYEHSYTSITCTCSAANQVLQLLRNIAANVVHIKYWGKTGGGLNIAGSTKRLIQHPRPHPRHIMTPRVDVCCNK